MASHDNVNFLAIASLWVLVAKRDVYIDTHGKASWTWKFARPGSWYVRSVANPTRFNANSVRSPLERYQVH